MKKFFFIAIALLAFLGCSDDDSKGAGPQTIEVSWSLSGSIGSVSVDSVRSDMPLSGSVSRSGSSALRINGFDTTYFEKKISIMHVQNFVEQDVDVDDAGNFTFDNVKAFVLQGHNSIRFTPKVKANVNLSPYSITLHAEVR